jgi:hypothetical protein
MAWIKKQNGFLMSRVLSTARVIAMIINEAWFALEEGISTKRR